MTETITETNSSILHFRFESTNSLIISKADELHHKALEWKQYKRQRNRDFRHAFNVILTGVEVYGGYEPDNWLRITTGNNAFSGETCKGTEYTSEQKEAVLFLITQGYIEKADGVRPIKSTKRKFKRKPAWLPYAYTLTSKWRNEVFNQPQCANHEIVRNHLASYVVLRDTKWRTKPNGKKEKYKATLKITNAHRLNHADLFKQTEDLQHEHDKLMAQTHVSLGSKTIPSAQTFMRRIFSHDSFEMGGRLYHDLQNRAAETRKYLRFNDEPTIEVDYSGIHPSLLYAKAGLKADANSAYQVDGFSRDYVKVAFNILINREGTRDTAYAALTNNLELSRNDAKRLVEGLYEAISKYFNTGYGLELQYLDSQMAMQVIDHFVNKMRHPIIAVHDSFIVSVRDTEDLILTMVDAYRSVGEESVHQNAMLSGVKGTSLEFTEALMTAITQCFKQDTDHLDAKTWNKLLAEEPVQECTDNSAVYGEEDDD